MTPDIGNFIFNRSNLLLSLNLLENMRLHEEIGFGRAAVVGVDVGRNNVSMHVEDLEVDRAARGGSDTGGP